jgi:drug/metabolite transporter (DMT)-like permease
VPVAKLKAKQTFVDPDRGPLVSVRFVVAIILVVVGIAWMVYYYTAVRVDPTVLPAPAPGSPKFMADLEDWNYAIGFGLILLGLLVSAHHDTPLGRGRGVVVGMLSCFLIGLIWICTFYVLSGDQLPNVPIFNDLGQYNLMVGIGFMAVGFAFATRWE